jgi:hypothetical protein
MIADVKLPFAKKPVPLIVDVERHPALKLIESWGTKVKPAIAEACFANYQAKIAMIGKNPNLPRIRKASEVWKHLQFESIRIDTAVPDTVVLHLIPAWDIDEQIEICIKKDRIVYAGQFLMYPVDSYTKGVDWLTRHILYKRLHYPALLPRIQGATHGRLQDPRRLPLRHALPHRSRRGEGA